MLALLVALICPTERPACFTATATLRVGAREAQVKVVVEELPYPGPMNRWRYVFEAEARPLLAGVEAGRLHAATVCGTGLRVEARGAWRLDLRPTDPGVSRQLAGGAVKCRDQQWSVIRGPGRLEILVEEPGAFGQGR